MQVYSEASCTDLSGAYPHIDVDGSFVIYILTCSGMVMILAFAHSLLYYFERAG